MTVEALIKAGGLVFICSFRRHISAVRRLVCVRGTWLSSAGGGSEVVLAQCRSLASVQLWMLQLTVDNLV